MLQSTCASLPSNFKKSQVEVYDSPSGKIFSVSDQGGTRFYNSDGESLFEQETNETLRPFLKHIATCPKRHRGTKRHRGRGDSKSQLLSNFHLKRNPHTHPRGQEVFQEEQVVPLSKEEKKRVVKKIKESLSGAEKVKDAFGVEDMKERSRTIWNLRKHIRGYERLLQQATSRQEIQEAVVNLERLRGKLERLTPKNLPEELSPEAIEAYDLLHRRRSH